MSDTTKRLTSEDFKIYGKMVNYDDILHELESWDEGVALTLYENKGYKDYGKEHLNVIFMLVRDNIEQHTHNLRVLRMTGDEQRFMFEDSNGNDYSGVLSPMLSANSLTQNTFNAMDLGKEHFLEFLNFYLKSIFKVIIKEVDDDTDLFYQVYLEDMVKEVLRCICKEDISSFLGIEGEEPNNFFLRLIRDGVDGVSDNKNLEEVSRGDTLKYELGTYIEKTFKKATEVYVYDEDDEEDEDLPW